MKFFVFIILFTIAEMTFVSAQERYREEIADSVVTDTYTYAFKDGQALDMDVYTPAFDQETKRPLIFYVHGGDFSSGSRNQPAIKQFCKKLARYGYVVSSISYRLTRKNTETKFGCDCPAADKLDTYKEAVKDLQDATFFMIERRELFRIDPQKIILSGSNAGAKTALNTAYQPPYCYGLDSGPVSYAGVISMAGAVPDTARIYAESAVPSLLFHGTCDNMVPYATGPHRLCKNVDPGYLVLNGSQTIAEKLKKTGTPFWFVTYCNAGNEISEKPMTDNFANIIDFCFSYVIKKGTEQRTTFIKSEKPDCDMKIPAECSK